MTFKKIALLSLLTVLSIQAEQSWMRKKCSQFYHHPYTQLIVGATVLYGTYLICQKVDFDSDKHGFFAHFKNNVYATAHRATGIEWFKANANERSPLRTPFMQAVKRFGKDGLPKLAAVAAAAMYGLNCVSSGYQKLIS